MSVQENWGRSIEYFGVTGSESYTSGVQHKKEVYSLSGIDCLYLDAKELKGAWPRTVLNGIHGILEKRLERIEDVRGDCIDRHFSGKGNQDRE